MPTIVLNGHRLAYREMGAGPLLLILPGNTSASAHLEGEITYFSQRFHCVALDFWGTGGSQRLDRWPVDWWQQGARDALALAAALGQPDCLAMGCSGGAWAALWMAVFAPEQVRAVVADSEVPFYPPDLLRQQVAARSLEDPGAAGFWKAAHGADWQEVVQRDSQLLLDFADAGGDMFGGALSKITCPVLFTASLADELLPDCGSQILAMLAQVQGSRAFLLREGAHPLMWSRPRQFRGAALAFLIEVTHQI
jgi:pimeloyl-ACP methyl ester carboxylesterase